MRTPVREARYVHRGEINAPGKSSWERRRLLSGSGDSEAESESHTAPKEGGGGGGS